MDHLRVCYTTRKANNGQLKLFLRVIFNGWLRDSSMHRKIDAYKWDAIRQRVKEVTEDDKTLNDLLESTRVSVYGHYNIMLTERKQITIDRLFDRIDSIGTYKECKLLQVFQEHNDRMKSLLPASDYALGTLNKYRYAYDKVKDFIKYAYNESDIELYKVDNKFASDFEQYLKVHDKIAHNTTMKYISNLKKIINLSVANGWLSHNTLATFKLTLKDVQRSQLDDDELLTMKNKVLGTRLSRIRDIFLFTCYTGLAYTDLLHLTWAEIQKGIDGKLWVIYKRVKTKNRAPVPLLPEALEILNKYRGIDDILVFPAKSNQKDNQYLKEVASACGINKRLHFHMGRHTFATTVTLSNGVPLETVSKMLGHNSLKTTQIYARVVDSKISEEMLTLQKRLTKKDDARKKAAQSGNQP